MKLETLKWILAAGFLAATVTACDRQEGPMEEAGESIDQAVEEAGDKTEDALERAGDAVEDATDGNNP